MTQERARVVPRQLSRDTRRFLRALASETRQQALALFADGAEHSVGVVAELLKVGQSTASEQLAQLKEGGLLTARREGKTVLYRVDADGISSALAELQTYIGTV